MSSLDMPQHIYVCRSCMAAYAGLVSSCVCCEGADKPPAIEPTLVHADFLRYMDALRARHGEPVPSDDDVWDRLESCTDTAPTNREAIDNAIRWVVSQR